MPDEVSIAIVDKEFSIPYILSVRGVILVVEDRLTEVYLREKRGSIYCTKKCLFF